MKGSWKDLFAFNKRERNGIFVLLSLIFLLIIVQFLMPLFVTNETVFEPTDLTPYLEQIKKDSAKWVADHSFNQPQKNKKFEGRRTTEMEEVNKKPIPRNFNPNQATFENWSSVGLSKKQVSSINNYLNKGGKFIVKKDVLKMYVINEKKFDFMKSYLLLPDTLAKEKSLKFEKKGYPTTPKYDTIIVELNTADTTQLMKIRGIGSYYARQIIYYRDKLGGYQSISQLYEIERMREETVQKIEPFVTVDTTLIHKLKLNSDDASVLVRHPYITWNMAKKIQDHRDFDRKFKSKQDLLKYGLLTEELYTNLVAYIEL